MYPLASMAMLTANNKLIYVIAWILVCGGIDAL
jgi:hypothetical protein